MELNEMEKKLLFQVEGDYQTKILNELYMTVRYSNNSEQREAAEGLMAKLRVLSNAECMDLVKDIQKNYRLPYPARTIGEKIAEARQQSGAEKLKGHDIMALERFDPEVKHKLKIQMSAKRQEIEKTRRLIRGLYENFVQGILTNDEYFELKADYEHAINALSGEIEVFEKSMDSLDNQLARYRAMEKDAKTLAQDHVLTVELIERLIERIEIDHERNIHVTFRFKNEFQGKAVEPCATM